LFLTLSRPPNSTLFPYTTLFRSTIEYGGGLRVLTETFSIDNCTLTNNVSGATTSAVIQLSRGMPQITNNTISFNENPAIGSAAKDRKSTRLNSSHVKISYAVFCL